MSQYRTIAKVLTYLCEHQEEHPTLEQLAHRVHLSPHHFQRLFTSWVGVSPKTFLQYLSIERAKTLLQEHTLLQTTHKTKLSGTGRLHDLFVHIEGMTPGEYKNGGRGLTIYYSHNTSPFGPYLIASTEKGVCNLFFYDTTLHEAVEYLRSQWSHAKLLRKSTQWHRAVHIALTTRKKVSLPLHLRGTKFQLKVWQALLSIPEGSLVSYKQVARIVKEVNASRAVGSAIGKNPIAYLIPCHRVIKSLGIIGSYHWGTARKAAIIGSEAVHIHKSH